jgi:hypothetical protein
METPVKPNSQSIAKATATVLGLLPQVAGLVLGLSALAYIVGWREMSAFYGGLGAPWAASLLTTVQVTTSSIWIVSGIGLFFLVAIYLLSQRAASASSLRRWSIILMVAALAMYLTFLLTPVGVARYFAAGMSICWSWSTGLALGELVGSLAENNLKWHSYHVHVLYFVLTFGLIYVSDILGSAQAKTLLDSQGARFPDVVMHSETQGIPWKLIAPVGDKMLLISFDKVSHKHTFKLVVANNIDTISAFVN